MTPPATTLVCTPIHPVHLKAAVDVLGTQEHYNCLMHTMME